MSDGTNLVVVRKNADDLITKAGTFFELVNKRYKLNELILNNRKTL